MPYPPTNHLPHHLRSRRPTGRFTGCAIAALITAWLVAIVLGLVVLVGWLIRTVGAT